MERPWPGTCWVGLPDGGRARWEGCQLEWVDRGSAPAAPRVRTRLAAQAAPRCRERARGRRNVFVLLGACATPRAPVGAIGGRRRRRLLRIE
jgi:hypothetical protein